MYFAISLLGVLLLTGAPAVNAQDTQDDLAKEAVNPIANLMSVPIQNNVDYGIGPYDRSSDVMNFQPVVPFGGGKWITRTIFPFVWIPDVTAETGTLSSGLSDILFTAFYVPGSGSTMWGLGPVLEFPTGGEIRGSQKWSAGLSGVLLAQPAYYSVESPEYGPEWQWRFQFQFFLPVPGSG